MTEITKKNILVTGANGFIGRSLCAGLKKNGYFVRAAVRGNDRNIPGADECVKIRDMKESTDWQDALAGVDVVVHLAARVHVINDPKIAHMETFLKANALGTEHLAQSAAKAGVKRFIFISTIGVNSNFAGRDLLTERDEPNPIGAYAVSKWEAEKKLKRVEADTGMEVVILRPPLVYGPGVKANFKSLIRLAGSGLPLPFGGVRNRRSFIYIGNLIDAIGLCIVHSRAAGETFLVSDGQDVSTPELIKMIASAMGRKLALFSLPPGILKILCKVIGKSEDMRKLTGNLSVDISKIKSLLDWKPPFTLEEGIRETIRPHHI